MQQPRIDHYIFTRPPFFIAGAIGSLRDGIGPMKSIVSDDRLHSTLAALGGSDQHDRDIAQKVASALDGFFHDAVRLTLDRLTIEPGIALLQAVKGRTGIDRLKRSLVDHLHRAGIDATISRSLPHVTLGYSPAAGRTHPISPIGWLVNRIDLVESVIGRTIHRTLASWELRSNPNDPQCSFDFGPTV